MADAPRRLPGTQSVCPDCREPIVWARLVATTMNRGGKDMAFNPTEDPLGRVAVYLERAPRPTRLFARPLLPGEEPDPDWDELLASPHSPTCAAKPPPPPSFDGTNVTELAAWRRNQ